MFQYVNWISTNLNRTAVIVSYDFHLLPGVIVAKSFFKSFSREGTKPLRSPKFINDKIQEIA